jgi:SecD/SecF fusion protein
MRLPSRTTSLIAGVLVLTIAAGLAWQFYQARQPDIADVGGTILVYQLDKKDNPGNVDATVVAEALQRRFGFDEMRHVKVRPGDGDQVEVLIPRVGDHEANVQSIKEMVGRVGRLEFRILANSADDNEAIEAAKRMVNHEREIDDKLRQECEDAEQSGRPPPGPRFDGQPRKFNIALARGLLSTVSYRWIELGQPERRTLHLDNAARADPQRDAAWKEAAAHRGQALQLPDPIVQADFLLRGALFYSRVCKNRNLTDKERGEKEVEYFVLTRDPEYDPATGQRSPDIDGSYLASVFPDRDPSGRLVVGFAISPAGAELFGALTRKNVREGPAFGMPAKVRHLGIVLDGQVMTAPTLNSGIRERGTIAGSFTDRQIAEMVGVLRAGALPGALLPRPVRETVVEAGHGR